MASLLGFTRNLWSKPTWFKLFRSTAHSLFYNYSSNMCQNPNCRYFLLNITFENDSHIHVMSSFKWYFFILKSMCMFPTSIPYLCAQI